MTSGTYFYDENGDQIANETHVIPLPLFKGMLISIHGYSGIYRVAEWTYHHGQPDENGGLHIHLLKQANLDSSGEPFHDQEAALKRVKEAAAKKLLEKLNI